MFDGRNQLSEKGLSNVYNAISMNHMFNNSILLKNEFRKL